MADNKRKKITTEQRLIMISFMEEHRDLAANRIQDLDAKSKAASLWEQLAAQLNSCGSGATKETDKWIKSWRDWRTETKSKASKLKNYMRGTGGGGPSPASLTEVEGRLISLMGIEAIDGHSNVIDPAEPQNWIDITDSVVNNKMSLPPVKASTVTVTLPDLYLSNNIGHKVQQSTQSPTTVQCTSALFTHMYLTNPLVTKLS